MLDQKAASAVTDRIKSAVDNLWDLIVLAYQGRVWIALGYPSWDVYCVKELGDLKFRLPKEDRREIMVSLRDNGVMSSRAIASATGYDKRTVCRDLSAAEPPAVVIGVNGKNYRRHPVDVADALWRTSCSIAKMGDKVAKLAGDSEFGTATERVKEASLRDLRRTREALNQVIAKLEGVLDDHRCFAFSEQFREAGGAHRDCEGVVSEGFDVVGRLSGSEPQDQRDESDSVPVGHGGRALAV